MSTQTDGEQAVPGGFESPFEAMPSERFTVTEGGLGGEAFTVGEGFDSFTLGEGLGESLDGGFGEGFDGGFGEGFDEVFSLEGPLTESETFPSGVVLSETTGRTGPGEEHWDPNNTGLPLLSTGPAVRSQKVSRDFTVGELVLSGKYADVARISPALVDLLQRIRDRAGRPVSIFSGYRSWKRNGVVYKGYGKPPTRSRHCSGQAADIRIAGYTGMQIAKLAIDVWGPTIGVGIGGDHAHVDVRPEYHSWTYLAGDASRRAKAEIDAYRKARKSSPLPPPVPVPPVPVPIPVVPGATGPGSLTVPRSALLASHRGTHPDIVVGWNAMSSPVAIDIVVHLHGHSPSGEAMQIDPEKVRLSGLELAARSRPTVTILPRGDFYGGGTGRGYDFPALTPRGRLDALIASALAAFTARTHVSAPRGRLILTAHSGGGKALLAILKHTDPDEVFIFDALYQSSTPLGDWMESRIGRHLASPASPPPAMRVLYRADGKKSTQPSSEALARRLGTVLSVSGAPVLTDRFRVERTTEQHISIARRYGSTLLGDAGANLPDTARYTGVQHEQFGEPESLAWEGYESETSEAEYESEYLDTEQFDPEAEYEAEYLDTEQFDPEAEYEAEYLDTEQFDPEAEYEAEYLDTEQFDPEAEYEAEYLDTEQFDPETDPPVARFAPEALDTEVVSLAELVAEEFEDEEGEAEGTEAEATVTGQEGVVTSEVAYPSSLVLAPAPAYIATHPTYADPNNAGVPLVATPPSTYRLKLAPNFTVRELASSGGKASPYSRISPDLVRVLQAIRSRVGRPVYVDSGYRRWAQALAVAEARGGHPRNTRHASGQAADIRVIGLTGPQLAQMAIDAVDDDLALGIGSNYVHVDVRGTWKLWSYIPGAAGEVAKQVVLAQYVAKKGGPPKPKPTPPPTPAVDGRFSVIKPAFLATTDPVVRAALLQRGISFAGTQLTRVRKEVTKPTSQTSLSRARIIGETGVGRKGGDFPFLEPNPFAGGVTNDRFEQAYRAWAENPSNSVEPWMLMAIWVKEGLTTPQIPPEVSGNDSDDARSIWRSRYYYVNMGIDHYVALLPKQPGKDNQIDDRPGSGAKHDRVLRAAVAAHVSATRLPRDVSAEIDAELTVSNVPGAVGQFSVTPTARFFVLSLMLMDAFWREMRASAAAAPAVATAPPSSQDLDGLTYLRWNMVATSFNKFLARDMTKSRDPDGTVPPITVWAFHREVRKDQFGQPRANAIRLQHTVPVYREVYEG